MWINPVKHIFLSWFHFSYRAWYKLEAAIEQMNVDASGKIALDSGLSTGGFTDCLLQHGATFVYGVDVGYGQVSFFGDLLENEIFST